MARTTSIMLAGVGGQGTILASRVLAQLLLNEGYDVKMSEVHGMAQRGGSVTTHVRYGNEVDAPTIPPGQADFILVFETMEAARVAHYLKPGGTIVANMREISSLPILIAKEEYPDDIPERLLRRGIDVRWVDAYSIADKLGNIRVENVALLGAFSTVLPFSEAAWKTALTQIVPERHIELNMAAFDKGRQLGKK
ncbi:MAG: indolepyruvate oxidoreductase subunit beta [Firmicutes bacterium]|jgi:indolepyruvate ferredoxin oxidoreductase beta subunit|nr:indolepyruvate oxidoreductase subunit beta [Bacillota bacterium]MDD4336719.1 indolepyruvate oxidoreductase subunit beta [Bacillota bacterium]MDD4792359.1 indolepyruvate oxidoreductase subunit beta [Bacillota bacterium]